MFEGSTARQLSAVAATALCLTVVPSAQAEEPSTGPSISGVELHTEFGGLTPYIPTGCGLDVEFTDATPSTPGSYRVLATTMDGETTAESTDVFAPEEPSNLFKGVVSCPTLGDGDIFDVVIIETVGSVETTSPPSAFELSVVDHPDQMRFRTDRTSGSPNLIVGDVVNFFFDGNWEPGTQFSTQVWTSRTAEFTDGDFTANSRGGAKILGTYASPVLPSSFTVPYRSQGRFVWISVLGHKDGKLNWRYTFDAIKVDADTDPGPQAQPGRWVKNFGDVAGKPRVGKTVKATGPKLSKAGRAAKVKVLYQWALAKKTLIEGATAKTYRIPAKYQGKKLSVYVAVSKSGYTTRSEKLAAGVIRR